MMASFRGIGDEMLKKILWTVFNSSSLMIRQLLWVVVASWVTLVSASSSGTGEYFVPVDGELFHRWRRERLGGIPSLFEATDTTKYSREEIEKALWPAFLPRQIPERLNATVVDMQMRDPVRRAIYALVVLSDLDMACSPSPLNPWSVVSDLRKSVNGELNDELLALTFVMIIPSCTTVWQSFKSISEQHGVNLVQLTHHVAHIGSVEGTKWFIKTLRPRLEATRRPVFF